MFVGRNDELEALDKAYNKDGFQFPVIYGRRRVGKTALINEFCKGKKSIYFVATQSTAKANLHHLSRQILLAFGSDVPDDYSFASFNAALDYVFAHAKDERIVFAIDEYPYLAESDRSVSSVLQAAIDKYQDDSKLFLILCGSSMSFMEEEVLGYKSPLYGRRTAQFKLLALDYFTGAELLGDYSNEDKLLMYSITGGIPEYLSRIDSSLSVKENVLELFFSPSGRLFDEPSILLKQELSGPQTYHSIVESIADGKSKLNEIATQVGIETSAASHLLNTLIALGIVKKEVPITEKPGSKKTLYMLDDQMFVFWFRFVKPELSRITIGLGESVCDEVFEGQIQDHVGHAFEQCAIQCMWRKLKAKTLPVQFKRIGRWWGNNPVERREEEIDFIAIDGDSAIFGECKWRNQELGLDVLDDLVRRAGLFPAFRRKHYALFSKSGFSDGVLQRAALEKDILLFTPDDMFR